ncbi:hypothetical protein MVEN_00245600 [Mycena venus]|uniref:Uncharacterized protein n=1 Tax=Mycena venus TaxID=2733690 RepID=A0A8H6Z2B2_9AGAR|nr:hypothetical protein MVEN_00245600 [Mycena venus]
MAVFSSLSSMDWTNAKVKISSRKSCARSVPSFIKAPFLSASSSPADPEPHIRGTFIGELDKIDCALNVDQSFWDVRKFLSDEFARIHRQHHETMATVPLPGRLLKLSTISSNDHRDILSMHRQSSNSLTTTTSVPRNALKVIIGIKEPDLGSPLAALDHLYTQILSEVPAQPQLLKVLAVIAAKFQFQVGHIEQFLELEAGDARLVLRRLQSVIGAKRKHGSECNDWSFDSQIVVYHTSFYDFLQNPARAGIFYVGGRRHREDLSRRILKGFSYAPSTTVLDNVSW